MPKLDTKLVNHLKENDEYKKVQKSHFISLELSEYIKDILQKNTLIRNVLNIGFGYGHSAELFLSVRPDINVISVDSTLNKLISDDILP